MIQNKIAKTTPSIIESNTMYLETALTLGLTLELLLVLLEDEFLHATPFLQ